MTEKPRPRRRIRLLKWLGGLACVLVALYLLRGPLFGGLLRDRIAAEVRDATGLTIAIDGIEGSWLWDMTLVGCRVTGLTEADQLRVLSAGRIAVEYDLLTVLGDPLAGIRSVDVSELDVQIVIDDEPGDWENTASILREIIALPLGSLPPVRVDAAFSLLDDDVLVESRIGLQVAGGRVGVALDDLVVDVDGARIGGSGLRTEIAAEPGALAIEGTLVGDGFSVEAVRLHEDDGRMQLDATVTAGGRIDASLWQDSIDVRLVDVDLAAVPEIVEQLIGEPLPDGVVTTGAVELRRRRPIAFAGVAVRDVAGYGVHIDSATIATGTFDGEHLTAAEIRATRDDAVLTVDAMALDIDAPLASLGWSGLRLSAPDLHRNLRGVTGEDALLPVTDAIALVASSAALAERRGDVTFDARTQRSSAHGSMEVSVPTADELTDGRRQRTLREVITGLTLEADVDVAELLPHLPDSWQLSAVTGRLAVGASGTDPLDAPQGSLNVVGTSLEVDGHAVEALELRSRFDGIVVIVEHLLAATTFGRLQASGVIGVEEQRARELTYSFASEDLSRLSHAFPALPALNGSLHVDGATSGDLRGAIEALLEGRTDLPESVRASIRATGDELRVADAEVGRLSTRAELVGALVTVEECEIEGVLARIDARGAARIDGHDIDVPTFVADIGRLESFARWIPGLDDLRGAVRLSGALHVDDIRDLSDVDGELDLTAAQLAVAGQDFDSIRVHAVANEGDIHVTELAAHTPWGDVQGGGTLRLDGDRVAATLAGAAVRLDRSLLLLDGDPIPVRIHGPVEIEWDADRLDVRGLRATTLGGEVRADASIGSELVLDAVVDGVDLARLGGDLRGTLDAHAQLEGATGAPQGSLTASVPALGWGKDEGRVAIDVTQRIDGIHFTGCELDAGPRLRVSAAGFLPFRLARGGVTRASDEQATLEADATCIDPSSWLARFAPAGFGAQSATASLRASGGRMVATATVNDLAWIDFEDDAGMRLVGETTAHVDAGPAGIDARIDGGSEDLTVSGHVTSPQGIDWRSPQSLLDDLFEAPLEGDVVLAASDLRSFSAWIDALRNVRGRGRATVSISGSLASPNLGGSIEADDVWLRAEADLPAIDKGHLRAVLEGRTIRIDELTGRLGYAPFSITGTVDVEDVTDPVLDLHVEGQNAQVLRSPYLRARANLDLSVSGPVSGVLLRGDVELTDVIYTQPIDLLAAQHTSSGTGFALFSLRDPPLSEMRFDVHVLARDTVIVDNNVLRGRFSADLQLGGTGRLPAPVGRVEFDSARVRLPLTRLSIDRGVVEFPAEDPFEPVLSVSAFARLQGYDLDIRVRGGISDARLFIASSPPLSQEDSLFLLATGAPPQNTGGGVGGVGGAAMAGAGNLLGEATMAWLSGSRAPGEDSFADRINVEVGRERSETGYATIEAEVRIVPRWYLRFERDRWDHYDAGLLWRIRFR